MRRTVRSVGAAYGIGCFCVKFSMMVALAHAASDRSASIVGASEASIRVAVTLGRTKPGAGPAGREGRPARALRAGAAVAAKPGPPASAHNTARPGAIAPAANLLLRTPPPGILFWVTV